MREKEIQDSAITEEFETVNHTLLRQTGKNKTRRRKEVQYPTIAEHDEMRGTGSWGREKLEDLVESRERLILLYKQTISDIEAELRRLHIAVNRRL